MATLSVLLERLRCPTTRQQLTIAEPELIERLNDAITRGELSRADGAQLTEPLDGGLVCEDQKTLYPIQGALPVLLPQDAITLP